MEHKDFICPKSKRKQKWIWTDHDKPGTGNACADCSDKDFKSLTQLNAERKAHASQTGGK